MTKLKRKKPKGYIDSNGDIVQVTPLRGIEVYPNYFVFPEDPNYEEFKEAYLRKIRNQSADKFEYSIAGLAPLHYYTEDSPNSVSDLEEESFFYDRQTAKQEAKEIIAERQNSGFYQIRPFQYEYDNRVKQQYDSPCYGWSCIFSNTNVYGSRFGNMSNINFGLNPKGFEECDVNSELERGDIVQLRRPWLSGYEGKRPFHATMFNSYNESNDSVRVYDNHGYIIPHQTENSTFVLDLFNFHPESKDPSAFKGFKFIGDNETENEIREAYIQYKSSTSHD